MSSIRRRECQRPTLDLNRAPGCSVRAATNARVTHRRRTARPAPRTEIKPKGFGNGPHPAALMGMLSGLFGGFFKPLHNLLFGDTRPPEPKHDDLPLPRVQPLPDAAPFDKQDPSIHGLSTKRNGVKPNNIWDGFRQGKLGNCVTVSAIKAAMAKFGQSPTDIFKSVEKVAQGYKVVMRDNFELQLKQSELDQASLRSGFVLLNDWGMLKDAYFLFACSAKRAQMENNDGWARRSFGAAIDSLNDREDEWGPGEGLKRLGLKDHMQRVPALALADRSLIGMVNRRGHSVAVVDGREENYGRQGRQPTDGQAIALI